MTTENDEQHVDGRALDDAQHKATDNGKIKVFLPVLIRSGSHQDVGQWIVSTCSLWSTAHAASRKLIQYSIF